MRLGERGAVAAEFAVTLPAVLLVLAFAVGLLMSAGASIRLQDAAADAARLIARGDSAQPALDQVGARVSMKAFDRGELICVRLDAPLGFGGVVADMRAAATSCALPGGR